MTESARPLSTLNLIWLGMLAAVPIYAIVGWKLVPTSNIELSTATAMIFPLMAAMESAAALLLPRFLEGSYPTICIIRWALAESVAIFGLALLYVGGGAWLSFGLMGWSFVLIAVLGPSRDALERSE